MRRVLKCTINCHDAVKTYTAVRRVLKCTINCHDAVMTYTLGEFRERSLARELHNLRYSACVVENHVCGVGSGHGRFSPCVEKDR